MQGKFAVLIDDRMTGVAAALIANDDIIVLGQQVYHPALALVAPVDANDCAVSHNVILRFYYKYCVFWYLFYTHGSSGGLFRLPEFPGVSVVLTSGAPRDGA